MCQYDGAIHHPAYLPPRRCVSRVRAVQSISVYRLAYAPSNVYSYTATTMLQNFPSNRNVGAKINVRVYLRRFSAQTSCDHCVPLRDVLPEALCCPQAIVCPAPRAAGAFGHPNSKASYRAIKTQEEACLSHMGKKARSDGKAVNFLLSMDDQRRSRGGAPPRGPAVFFLRTRTSRHPLCVSQ